MCVCVSMIETKKENNNETRNESAKCEPVIEANRKATQNDKRRH